MSLKSIKQSIEIKSTYFSEQFDEKQSNFVKFGVRYPLAFSDTKKKSGTPIIDRTENNTNCQVK